LKHLLGRIRKSRIKNHFFDQSELVPSANQKISNPKIPTDPISIRFPTEEGNYFFWNSALGADHSFRIKFYRFLKDNIPVLNSAIWTWTHLCSAQATVQIKGSDDPQTVKSAEKIIADLDRRIYEQSYQKFGGTDALLVQFFNSLFTDGIVCGELVLTPSGDKIDKFYFIDPATIRFELKNDRWEIFQQQDGSRQGGLTTSGNLVKLNPDSTFYFGLDTQVNNPIGKSLLSSIPFVARVEQQLVSDMQKTMHNAGYHRLHVKIKPPERSNLESDEAYISRANNYFDKTVEMMRQFGPDDNPITWNDVEIDYIGPESRQAASSAWYINHKAMIEDIAAGVHLDPFMLGYSYGLGRSWAGFKLELIFRNVVSIQKAAKRFMEWVRNIELALHGFDLETEHHFDNTLAFGKLEQLQAEKMALENIRAKQEAGYIDFEEAKREVEKA